MRLRPIYFLFVFVSVCFLTTYLVAAEPVTEPVVAPVQGFAATLKAKLDTPQMLNSKQDTHKNVAQFYKARNFQPLWVEDGAFLDEVDHALEVLKNAEIEGLNPRDYAKAAEAVAQARADTIKLLEAEMTLSALVMEYIDDLLGERLNPRRIGKALYLKMKKIDAVKIMSDGIQGGRSLGWLKELTIQHPEYQMLKGLLADYKGRQSHSHYPALSTGAKIEMGTKGGRIETLQWQLLALGYLKGGHTQGEVGEITDQAIRAFQGENQLKADGIVGAKTTAVLNSYNLDDRIQKITIAMERWRWMPEDLGERYIQVNIAGFELAAIEGGQEKLRMPVIIGRNYRKTPVFNSDIYSVRFNPSWHVPRSIAVKDKLKKIRRDPGYLTRGGYVLYDAGGSRISPHDVNWSTVSASNFNFRIRQNPGSNNALGKIRFAIKSPFNVYLHSTPDKHLFKRNVRSFSSGCVRVGDPKALAGFIFNDEGKWPQTRISQKMEGTQTQNVGLSNPVKVYITYFTVWKGQDGTPKFGQDIYGQDEAIWAALKNRKGFAGFL